MIKQANKSGKLGLIVSFFVGVVHVSFILGDSDPKL